MRPTLDWMFNPSEESLKKLLISIACLAAFASQAQSVHTAKVIAAVSQDLQAAHAATVAKIRSTIAACQKSPAAQMVLTPSPQHYTLTCRNGRATVPNPTTETVGRIKEVRSTPGTTDVTFVFISGKTTKIAVGQGRDIAFSEAPGNVVISRRSNHSL